MYLADSKGRAACGSCPAGGAGGAEGFGGRGGVGRPGRLPRVREAKPAALDPDGGADLLLRDQGRPGGGCADPSLPVDHRDGRPGRLGRQGGQYGHCGAVARRRGTDPDARFEAVSATLRAVAGAGFLAPSS